MELRLSPVECFRGEGEDFPFLVDDEPECDGLYASCREFRLNLPSEHRRQFEAHEPVQNPSGLLCVNQVHIDVT